MKTHKVVYQILIIPIPHLFQTFAKIINTIFFFMQAVTGLEDLYSCFGNLGLPTVHLSYLNSMNE